MRKLNPSCGGIPRMGYSQRITVAAKAAVLATALSWSTSIYALSEPDLIRQLKEQHEIELAWGVQYRYATDLAITSPAPNAEDAALVEWLSLAATAEYPATVREAAWLEGFRRAVHLDREQDYQQLLEAMSNPSLSANDEGQHKAQFHTIRPMVLNALYENHVVAENTIPAYLAYIETYPNSVESADAIQRVEALAFANATTENTLEVYDAYIAAFPTAAQATEASERAFTLEREALLKLVDSVSYSDRTRQSRRLYNSGRQAEKRDQLAIASRKYRLLETLFDDTDTYTEYLDREERREWQAIQTTLQQRQSEILTGVRGDIQQQTSTLVLALGQQTGAINAAIGQQTQTLSGELASYRATMQEQRKRLAGTGGFIMGSLNALSSIGDTVRVAAFASGFLKRALVVGATFAGKILFKV